MNYLILTAAILALIAFIAHVTMGQKNYLKPIMESEIDAVPKKFVQSLFHYLTVFLLFSTIILLAGSHSSCPLYAYVMHMVRFIAVVYGLFAVTSLVIALTSKINGGMLKLFQWILFTAISTLAVFGSM